MGKSSPQLTKPPPQVLQRFENGEPVFNLYGRWNALVAENEQGEYISWTHAHDGDFFPESPLDHIEALRKAIRLGDDEQFRSTWPVRVDIDITQECNCRCRFCYSRPYNPHPTYSSQYVDLADLTRLIEELGRNGTRTIRYTGGGEPLLHPHIDEILPLARKRGLRSCILTNGDFLDENKIESIFHNVDHLRWSVNAATDETRKKIHSPSCNSNSLTWTFGLVRELVEMRRLRRPEEKKPMIWTTFLILPWNRKEIFKAAKNLEAIGVDSVSFRPVYHGFGGKWSQNDLFKLEDDLKSVKKLSQPPAFSVFVPKRSLFQSPNLNPVDYFKICLSRRFRTVLEATKDGLAFQTCGMYRGSGVTDGLVLGPRQLFSEIWSNAGHIFKPYNPPADCDRCIDISMGTTLDFCLHMLRNDIETTFYRAFLS